MPKYYKTFEIPTGTDEANIPMIFQKFVDSGIAQGSVIAHFATFPQAREVIANFPDGSFAWIQATLCRSNGSDWIPTVPASEGYSTHFETKADRDAFYASAGLPPGSLLMTGQLASIGTSGSGLAYLTIYDGKTWSDHVDQTIRSGNLEGDHQGHTVSVGDPNNPFNPSGVGFRKVNGYAINLAGNTFVDGSFTTSNTTASHNIYGKEISLHAQVYTNGIICGGIFTGYSTVEGRGGLFGPTLNANGIGPRDQSNTSRLDYYGVGVFNNGVYFLQNQVVAAGVIIQNNGIDATGANSFIRGNLWVTGTTITAGLQYSDRRMKKDINSAPNGALNYVKSIPVRSFTMRGKRSTYGWIAQEVEESLASAVTDVDNQPDGKQVLESADGKPLPSFKGLDITEMTATLWKAVQELSAEVEILKARLAGQT